MSHLKVKIIFSTLLLLFLFCLIPGTGPSFAEGKNGAQRERSQAAPQVKSSIAATPRDIEQIFIPAGEVTLGSDKEQKSYAYSIGGPWAKKWRWFDGEKKRRVFVADFYIDKYPVTEAQYFWFIRDTGHRTPYISARDYQKQGFLVHSYEEVKPYLWIGGNKGETGHETTVAHRWSRPPADKLDNPVVLVSVGDAEAYCRWRGNFTHKKTFGLPTEDQWEKAARGSDGRYFPWGNSWDPARANIGSTGPNGTTAVDRYDSGVSPYGVYEMAGNIFEWTATPAKNTPNRQVLKSCSWDDMPGFCRGAARHSRLKTSRHILIGFRCVSVNNDK